MTTKELNVRTKDGKLTSVDGTITLKPIMGMPLWTENAKDLHHATIQKVGLMYTLILDFEGNEYTLEYISVNHIEGVREYFKQYLTDVKEVGHILASNWYQNIALHTYTAEYKDAKELSNEAAKASKYGWSIKSTTGGGKEFATGRALVVGSMSLGIGLLAGLAGKKGKITATFER